MHAQREWWQSAFGAGVYPLIEATRKPEWRTKTDSEVAALRRLLGIRPGSRVLDLACGTGRHSIALAAGGCEVTGFDYSAPYLAEARRSEPKRGARVRWIRGDMRRLPFEGEFDAAINLFSSFGYFSREADDLRTLRGVARALKPGGFFLIELFNGQSARERLETCERKGWPATHWGQISDGVLTLEDPKLTRGGAAIRTDWLFMTRSGRRAMTSYLRVYTRRTLTASLRRAGLRVVRVMGGFDEPAFRASASRRHRVPPP